MSYLENQASALKSTLSSTSHKISNKRYVGAPSAKPAPSSTPTATRNDLKRKQPDGSAQIASQPANTGTGQNIMTQVTYAIEYLKSKGAPQSLDDLVSYLSILNYNDAEKRVLGTILKRHDKVNYDRAGLSGKGTFSFRPVHNISSGEQLVGFLQRQRTAQGLKARDLVDGWPGAEQEIRKLEKEGKLLVTRNKKDNHAKMVWLNDPSLAIHIDDEFRVIWSHIKLPDPAALADELEKEGLTPTNKSRGIKAKPKTQEKKTKKPRRSGKTTNTHMAGVLKDYSHKKK